MGDFRVIRQSSDNLWSICKLIRKPSEHLRQFDCLSQDVRVTAVAFGSSSENIRTLDSLQKLLNRFE